MDNKNSEYLYFKIYSQLKQELINGEYKVGDAFPPERSLKERFSTTHITVRNALSRLVEEGYIERFSGRGTFVTFTGSGSTKKNREPVTAVHLVAGDFDPLFFAVMDCAEPELRKAGINIMVHAHRNDPILARAIGKSLSLQKESICIYFFLETEITPRIAEALPENSVLIVPADVDPAFSQIICDVGSGCFHAARYLSENSETPAAYIGDKPSFVERMMLGGFSGALEPVIVYSGGSGEGGYQACQKVLLREPACRSFFCASDVIAAGVYRFLTEKGWTRETDYRIAGFGATLLSETLEVPSVDPGYEKISQAVLQNVLDFVQTGKLAAAASRIKSTFTVR